jgi:hypothetical protein
VGVTNFSSSSRYRGVLSFLEKNGLILPKNGKQKSHVQKAFIFLVAQNVFEIFMWILEVQFCLMFCPHIYDNYEWRSTLEWHKKYDVGR